MSSVLTVLLRGHQELLKHMSHQKVQPNLQTFNAVLKALKYCGYRAKLYALQTLSEMKALGIGKNIIFDC